MFVSGLSESGAQSPTGVLFGLLSGFFYALYSIFGKVALKRYGSLTLTTYTFIFASAGIVPFCDYAGLAGIQWSPSLIGLVLAFAGGTGAAAYLLYTKGLERLTPTTAAVVAILEPVVAAIAGVVFFHETLGWAGFVGIALVVSYSHSQLAWPGRIHSPKIITMRAEQPNRGRCFLGERISVYFWQSPAPEEAEALRTLYRRVKALHML